MKRVLMIALVLALTCWGTTAQGSPLLHYQGTKADGSGPTQYAYRMDCNHGEPLVDFFVGTADPDDRHYSNVLIPDKWNFAIEDGGLGRGGGVATPIGDVSPGPVHSQTIAQAHWWTDDPGAALDSFTFGFDHPWIAEDVGWRLEVSPDRTYTTDWAAPVGLGLGPAHGPYTALPEPATVFLLLGGVIGLGARRRRT